jgi:hypothetical protein
MPLKTKAFICRTKDIPCTPKAPLGASTTPVSRCSRTPKPSRISTLEAAGVYRRAQLSGSGFPGLRRKDRRGTGFRGSRHKDLGERGICSHTEWSRSHRPRLGFWKASGSEGRTTALPETLVFAKVVQRPRSPHATSETMRDGRTTHVETEATFLRTYEEKGGWG